MELNVADLEADEVLVLSREKRKIPRPDHKPPFTMFGNGKLNRTGQSMDIIRTMTKLTPIAIKLFDVMLRRRNNDTNEVMLKPGDLESPRIIQNHMPSLILNEVVVRLGNCHYMINPDLVIPNHYQSAKTAWNSRLSTEQEEPTSKST